VKGVTVMKSERRHELQHNALSDALGDWTVKLEPYSRMIAGAVVLLLALGIAVAWVSGKGQRRVADGWDEYFDAVNNLDRPRLTEIAEKYAGTSVAPWARIVAADIALNEGTSQLFSDKTQGRELLRQAVDNYQTVFREGYDETITQRALYGLGRAHESLAGLDDLEKARGDYEKLIKGWPSGVYSTAAKERLADLQQGSTKKFYDWFAKYEPPKAASPSGRKPEFIEESLNKTDVELPSALDELKIDGPKIKSDSGSGDLVLPEVETESGSAAEPGATTPSAVEQTPESPATKSPQPGTEPAPTSAKPE
jgi:hypothetical protein